MNLFDGQKQIRAPGNMTGQTNGGARKKGEKVREVSREKIGLGPNNFLLPHPRGGSTANLKGGGELKLCYIFA